MSIPGHCPICDGKRLYRSTTLLELRVVRCRDCGHRLAIHENGSAPRNDYHEQYDNGAFLEALRETRVRQAGLLIGLIRKHVGDFTGLLDYGAGRGWFLESCRLAGIVPIAGVDTSQVSVDGLRAVGIEAHLLSSDENVEATLHSLSFRPRVLSLLDVIEHFPPERLAPWLRRIVKACGSELELVIVKVPIAGVLYMGAHVLSQLGVPGPLLRLYQVGTWPPHFNYFSAASAVRLLEDAGLSVVAHAEDRDFEPGLLAQRIGVKGPAARALARIGGEAIGEAARIVGRFDSGIFLAEPRK